MSIVWSTNSLTYHIVYQCLVRSFNSLVTSIGLPERVPAGVHVDQSEEGQDEREAFPAIVDGARNRVAHHGDRRPSYPHCVPAGKLLCGRRGWQAVPGKPPASQRVVVGRIAEDRPDLLFLEDACELVVNKTSVQTIKSPVRKSHHIPRSSRC